MKSAVMVGFLLVGMLLCSSCEFLREPASGVYQHVPSVEFYKAWDFSADYLSPFKSHNVLFTVRLDIAEIVTLDLFTLSPGQSVFIHEAEIRGGNRREAGTINAEFNVSDEVRNSELMAATVRLFRVRGDMLDELRHGTGPLTLDVSYSIDGVAGVMSFTMVRGRTDMGPLWLFWREYEVAVYEHGPTKKFYESWDLLAPYISPFTVSGIVFTTSITNTGFAKGVYYTRKHTVWFSLYAPNPPGGHPVFIHEAKIKGADRQLTKAINAEFNVTKKSRRNPDWARAGIALFDIREDKLEEMMLENNGTLTLEVSYSIDGVFSVMSFTLVRRVKKGLSWIT